MSLFEWGAKQRAGKARIYQSKNEVSSLDNSENPRKSAEYVREQPSNKWTRSLNSNLPNIYGIKVKRQR